MNRDIFKKYNPNIHHNYDILEGFSEMMDDKELLSFSKILIEKKSWRILSRIYDSNRDKKVGDLIINKFDIEFNNWVQKELTFNKKPFAFSMKGVSIKKNLKIEIRDFFFAIVNFNFKSETMSTFLDLISKSKKKYIKILFEKFFNICSNALETKQIDRFLEILLNDYTKDKSSNILFFITELVKEISISKHRFSINSVNKEKLEKLITDYKINTYDDLTLIICSKFICSGSEALTKHQIKETTIDVLNKQFHKNFKKVNLEETYNILFLIQKFNFIDFDKLKCENKIDFIIHIINKKNENYINGSEDAKSQILDNLLSESEHYFKLIIILLNNISDEIKQEKLSKFITEIDLLKESFKTHLWFNEFSSFKIFKKKHIKPINGGYELETEIDTSKIESLTRKKSNYVFLPIKHSTYETANSYITYSANFSAYNKGNILTVFPIDSVRDKKTIQFIDELKINNFFLDLEFLLIKKTFEITNNDVPLKKSKPLNKYLFNNLLFHDQVKLTISEKCFLNFLKEQRPLYYSSIYKKNLKTNELFDEIVNIHKSNETIIGKIISKSDSGFKVEILGYEAFLQVLKFLLSQLEIMINS